MKIRRPTHATVVAYLALFAALGGGAYAASKIGTNDLKRGAVTSAKIKNGTISASDVAGLVVRRERSTASGNGQAAAVIRCKRNEQMLSGSGGWNSENSAAPAPTVGRTVVLTRGTRPKGVLVSGRAPAQVNTLVAQVICLPR